MDQRFSGGWIVPHQPERSEGGAPPGGIELFPAVLKVHLQAYRNPLPVALGLSGVDIDPVAVLPNPFRVGGHRFRGGEARHLRRLFVPGGPVVEHAENGEVVEKRVGMFGIGIALHAVAVGADIHVVHHGGRAFWEVGVFDLLLFPIGSQQEDSGPLPRQLDRVPFARLPARDIQLDPRGLSLRLRRLGHQEHPAAGNAELELYLLPAPDRGAEQALRLAVALPDFRRREARLEIEADGTLGKGNVVLQPEAEKVGKGNRERGSAPAFLRQVDPAIGKGFCGALGKVGIRAVIERMVEFPGIGSGGPRRPAQQHRKKK